MDNQAYIEGLIANARAAQKVLETYDQKKLDEICKVMARIVYDNAEPFAKMTVEETRMGVYEDKIKKNQGKPKIIWNGIKGKKATGILNYIEEEGLVEIAKPMGVVGAVTPCTNPIVTNMCNAMFAIKGANAVIVAPHPRAKKITQYQQELYYKAFDEMDVPKHIFQAIEQPSIDLTCELMKKVDVVVATGGMGMVKAAYSSGKPSFGVGAGNVQCIIDRDVNFNEAAQKAITGRIFDNGIICSGEQTIIAHKDDFDQVIAACMANGAYYTEDKEEVDKLRKAIFPEGSMNRDLVGQSVRKVAEFAGIEIPEDTKVIIVKPGAYGEADVFSDEKMCPVMTAYEYETWEEAVEIAKSNLLYEGAGHSTMVHSNNKEHIEYAGLKLPVSRLLVNMICSTMVGGSFLNSLNPTTTLGCGSWGNNSISENLFYTHLINVSRIAYEKPNAETPSDTEIWGE
jgi:succinate-semialdehyde dehydrogenase